MIRARGFKPAALPPASDPTSTAAAPSTMPDELPAWWTWLTASTSGWAAIATASKPPISPICTNEGLSAPSDCMSVPGRGCSSRARIVSPFTSRTGTTERAKRPSSQACGRAGLGLHRVGVDVVARKTVLGGDEVGGDALRQESSSGWRCRGRPARRRRRRPCRPGSSIRRRRRCARSFMPVMTWAAARFTASRPEAQKRLIWTPGVSLPQPALSTAARAMSPPASPTGSTQPSTTSSTRSVSRSLRSRTAFSAVTARSTGGHLVQRAVRLAAPARGADVVVDEGVGHSRTSLQPVILGRAQRRAEDPLGVGALPHPRPFRRGVLGSARSAARG